MTDQQPAPSTLLTAYEDAAAKARMGGTPEAVKAHQAARDALLAALALTAPSTLRSEEDAFVRVALDILKGIPEAQSEGGVVIYSVMDDVPEDISVAISYLEAALAPKPPSSEMREKVAGYLHVHRSGCLGPPIDVDYACADQVLALLPDWGEGWKLVPVEPTRDMLHAAFVGHKGDGPPAVSEAYSRMLAAAPSPSGLGEN